MSSLTPQFGHREFFLFSCALLSNSYGAKVQSEAVAPTVSSLELVIVYCLLIAAC